MVDDQVNRHLRIDLLAITAELFHRVAHGGKVDDNRNASKVLHQHARRAECDLALGGLSLEPLGYGLDVVFSDRASILIAQQILKQDFHRKRQTGNALESVSLGSRKAEVRVILAANLQGLAASEAVERGHIGYFPLPPVDRRWFGLSYWQGNVFTCWRDLRPNSNYVTSQVRAYKGFSCKTLY